jgi:WD40 repeat protein
MRHLVITVHGIRTFGGWQERLETLLANEFRDAELRVLNYKFGYFSVLAFLVPPLRWLVVRRFRKFLLYEAQGTPWDRIDVVGHSFGTHIIAWALYGIKESSRPRVNTILLAGSVLKSAFPWNTLLNRGVTRVVNDCGVRDSVLMLSQFVVLFTGMAGRLGFHGGVGRQFRNRWFNFDHSGYFLTRGQPDDAFMRRYWLPLLLSDHEPELVDVRRGGTLHGVYIAILNNFEPIKLAVYMAPVIAFSLWITSLYRESAMQARIALSGQLAAEAETVAPRYPTRALLLATEAVLVTQRAREPVTPLAEQALRNALAHSGGVRIPGSRYSAVSMAPQRKVLAVAGVDGGFRLISVAESSKASVIFTQQGLTSISALAFDPTERFLAIVHENGRVEVADTSSHEISILDLRVQTAVRDIDSVTWSPNGNWLVLCEMSSCRLLPLHSQVPTLLPESYEGKPIFSPDGTSLLFVPQFGGDGTLVEFTPSGPAIRNQLMRHIKGIAGGAYLDDNQLIVVTNDGTLRYLSLKSSGQSEVSEKISTEKVTGLAYSPEAHLLAIALEHQVLLGHPGDLAASFHTLELNLPASIVLENPALSGLTFSRDGTLLAGYMSRLCYVWPLVAANSNDMNGYLLAGQESDIDFAQFTADATTLAIGSKSLYFLATGEGLRLWDVRNKHFQGTPTPDLHLLKSYASAAVAPDRTKVATLDDFGHVDLLPTSPTETGVTPSRLLTDQSIAALIGVNPTNATIIARKKDDTIAVYTRQTDGSYSARVGNCTSATAESPPKGTVEVLDPSGTWLLGASAEGTLCAFNIINAAQLQTQIVWPETGTTDNSLLPEVTSGAHAAAFAYHGTLVSVDLDALPGQFLPAAILSVGSNVSKLSMSLDGGLVAMGTDTGEVIVINRLTGDRRQVLLAREARDVVNLDNKVRSLEFSPNHKWLAASGYMRTVSLWRLDPKGMPEESPIVLEGHEHYVLLLRFSPDSKWLFSGGLDATGRLWDMGANPIGSVHQIFRVPTAWFLDAQMWNGRRNLFAISTSGNYTMLHYWYLGVERLIQSAQAAAGRNFTRREWAEFFPGTEYRKTFLTLNE